MDKNDNRRQRRRVETPDDSREGEDVEGEEDSAVWGELDKKLRDVQSVLDRNRALIQQVNDNHQSKISENMAKNVSLIREINDNVSRVVRMYSDLGADFSRSLHRQQQRRGDLAAADPNSSN